MAGRPSPTRDGMRLPSLGKAKSRFRPWLPWLPLALLLLALSTVFLFGADRGGFNRSGLHNRVSANHLSVAENLSPEHNFLLFYHQTLEGDGLPGYAPYNRFPIGGYGLIKLATLPFGDDFAAKIYAARILFLLFFVGSAVVVWLSLCRLTGNRWVALTATLLAFSSYYLLYYSDLITPENGISLFGTLLTFHGMVVFVQEGRFRQLLIKACLALLLGWHVYALLVPFVVFGLARELYRARRPSTSPPPPTLASRIKGWAAGLAPSRYLTLGVVTLLFGAAILSFNLANEYRALDGEVPLAELPTVMSMTYRLGADAGFNEHNAEILEWGNFLQHQFYRIAIIALPFLISPFDPINPFDDPSIIGWGMDYLGVIFGVVAVGGAVVALLVSRHRMLLAVLVSAGFFWALPVRHNTAFNNFETVFYIGVPLVLFSVGLSRLRELAGGRLILGLSAAALLVFVLSAFQMAHAGHDRQAAESQEAVVADFERIRTVVEPGQSVFVPISRGGFTGQERAVNYYLAGRALGRYWSAVSSASAYDYLISVQRVDGPALLTPENSRIFLYRPEEYFALVNGQVDDMIMNSKRVASGQGHYDLYRSGNRLIYAGNRDEGRDAQFIGQDVPVVGERLYVSLSPAIHRAGFTDRSRWQWERGSHAGGWTRVSGSVDGVYMPRAADEGHQLRASASYTNSRGERVEAMTAPSLPVQPSDVYMAFFLHLYPVDVNDLPDDRREHGFDNLDFSAADGLQLIERPVVVRDLPDYDVARVKTGQFALVDGVFHRFWEAEFPWQEGQ